MYNTDIALEQGGGALLFFNDYRFPAAQARAILYGQTQNQTIKNSAGVLSTTEIPEYTKTVFFELAAAASNASAYIGGCVAGQEKILAFRGAGSVGSVFFSTQTGVTLVGPFGEISSINAHHSSNSQAVIRMIATAEDTWAVLETSGQVTLNLAS